MKILSISAVYLLVLFCAYFFGVECVYCQESGVQVVRQIAAKLTEANNDALVSSVDSFCTEIARIENSSSARVSYLRMSSWRKSRFQEAVTEWLEQFPREEIYQTKVILKAHNAQYLIAIAQLYVVSPLELDQAVVKESINQLNEISNILQKGIDKKISSVSSELSKKYPIIGGDFSLGKMNASHFVNYAPLLEDDLNYKRKYPLDNRHFNDIKKRIHNIIEQTNIGYSSVVDDDDISEWIRLKKEGKSDRINSLTRSLAENIKNKIYFIFSTAIQKQCDDIIDKAYGDVLPSGIISDYRRFGNDVGRLVDTSVVKKAFDEERNISQEQMKKWHNERKMAWDMIVASQPREAPMPIYDLPRQKNSRLWLVLMGNGIIITVFALYHFFRWRRTIKH